jgi:citrate lyase subunit beta/citryl-CoA lyase
MSDFGDSVNRMLEARSLLFVPGSDDGKLRKAFTAGADAVVADLEDSVRPEAKADARRLVAATLAEAPSGPARVVRLNAVDTPFFEDDLAVLEGLALDAIVLPKASPAAVDELAARETTAAPVIAIVETAEGLRDVHQLAEQPSVVVLALGAVDLGLELRLRPRSDRHELLLARSTLVLASAAAGLRPPFDAVHVDVRDRDGLEDECRYAHSLGFRGKACIHPDQVAVVNREFTPSEEDVARARRVVDAYEAAADEGRGALALGGEMIDLPVVEEARRILAAAERSST